VLSRDVVTVFVLINRGEVRVRILLARMLGFCHDGSLSIRRHSSFLHGFDETILYVRREINALPRIGLGRILESDVPATFGNYLNQAAADHFIGHFEYCIYCRVIWVKRK